MITVTQCPALTAPSASVWRSSCIPPGLWRKVVRATMQIFMESISSIENTPQETGHQIVEPRQE